MRALISPDLFDPAYQACSDVAGLGNLTDLSRQFTQVVLAATALYFLVGLVINLAQAQVSSTTGDFAGYAHALQQGILMVILLALASALPSLSASLRTWLVCSDGSAASAMHLWKSLAGLVLSIVLGGAGILMTVSVVWSGLELQVAHFLGMPGGIASGLRRMLILIVGGMLTLFAVLMANLLLSMFF